VDVEDYFSLVARDQMGLTVSVSPAVDGQVNRMLDLLDELRVTATCFIVGYVAQAYPDLVRRIVARGHEVASHGYRHVVMRRLTPAAFARDLRDSLHVLSDITGAPIRGFRAPAFSLRHQHRWAFPIMAEAGLTYDSSVRFVWPTGRGQVEGLVRAAASVGIIEFPGLAVGIGSWGVPIGGGGGLRMLPIMLSKWGLAMAGQHRLVPLYLHPYDVGPWPEHDWPKRPRTGRLRVAMFNALQRFGRRRLVAALRELVAISRVEQLSSLHPRATGVIVVDRVNIHPEDG
jgi:polysaccharide deacetylase family protein (PEP-CTERM system associated)